MKARYHLMLGDTTSAIRNYEEASKLFESMAYGTEKQTASLQSLLCRFEAHIAQAVWDNRKIHLIIDQAASVREYFSSLGGLTGHAGVLAKKYFDEMEACIHKRDKNIDIKIACYRPIFLLES